MRDPKRMESFLDTFKECWERVPDWRFMQLICNFQRAMGSDCFYLEDDSAQKIFMNSFLPEDKDE